MSKTIKYTGTQDRWPELLVTGKPSLWLPGQQEERSDAEAALLLATGLFSGVKLGTVIDSVTGAVTDRTGAVASAGGGGGGSSDLQALGTVSGAVPINLANGANIVMLLGAASVLSFTGTPGNNKAQRAVLTISNGAAGITWPAGIRWAGAGIIGSGPVLSSGVDKVVLDFTNNGGTLTIDGSYVGRVA
jgi:hypothetical protein